METPKPDDSPEVAAARLSTAHYSPETIAGMRRAFAILREWRAVRKMMEREAEQAANAKTVEHPGQNITR